MTENAVSVKNTIVNCDWKDMSFLNKEDTFLQYTEFWRKNMQKVNFESF